MNNFKNIGLIFGSTLLALILADLVFLMLGKAPKLHSIELGNPKMAFQISDNPLLGYEHRPGYRDNNPNLINSYESINKNGQRDRPRLLEKDKYRIILLGDSVTVGFGIKQREMLTTQIEEKLAGKAEVLNFGMVGYNTRAEVEYLKTYGLKYSPDLVVVNYTENDGEHAAGNTSGDHRYTYQRPWWVASLLKSSSLFRYHAVRYNWYQLGAYVPGENGENRLYNENHRLMGQNSLEDGLLLLAKIKKDHSVKILITIWPSFRKDQIIHRNTSYSPAKNLNGPLIIETLAKKYSLKTIRLAPHFRNRIGKKVQSYKKQFTILSDTMHPNEQGTKLGATVFAELLRPYLANETLLN